MSFAENNFDKIKIGFEGEGKIREFLKRKRIPFMQVDLMFKTNNQWYLAEIKTQEIFKSPPFDGHGLPQWQIDARMNFCKDTGVIPVFIVYDLDDKCIYIQSMKYLLEQKKPDDFFKTKGKKPRTIFNIKHFKRIEV